MPDITNNEGFIPAHGGYRNLITWQKSEIIYDGTAVWWYADLLFTDFSDFGDITQYCDRKAKPTVF